MVQDFFNYNFPILMICFFVLVVCVMVFGFGCVQVKLLLTHKADPTVCNKELKTPLDLACEFGRNRVSD
jgi:ankyrin repeat protein